MPAARFEPASAPAVCAPTRRRRPLSESTFLGLGFAAFLLAAGTEYALYHRLLRDPLRTRDAIFIRPAIKRWLAGTVVLQVSVIAACILYLVVLGSRHGQGSAWIFPAVGAVFGLALPLQFILMPIVRAFRP